MKGDKVARSGFYFTIDDRGRTVLTKSRRVVSDDDKNGKTEDPEDKDSPKEKEDSSLLQSDLQIKWPTT